MGDSVTPFVKCFIKMASMKDYPENSNNMFNLYATRHIRNTAKVQKGDR